MDLNPSRGHGFEFPGRLDDLLGHALVEKSLGGHAAHDACAADGDIAVLVGKKQGRADALVAAARGVCSVDGGEDGDAELVEFGVPEEGGAVASSVRIDLLLLRELHAAAVDEPHEGAMQPFGDIGDPEDVIRLSRDPGACHNLVVKADDDAPSAVDPAKTVDNAGRP